MDYQGWVTTVCNLLEYQVVYAATSAPTGVAAFDTSIPAAIDYTENRLQRDLNLLATSITTSTGAMTPNSRNLTLPSFDLPSVSNIPLLIGQPVTAGSILTTTTASALVNVNWPNNNIPLGDPVSLLNPIRVGGVLLGGVYNIIGIVDANNFTINITFEATFAQSVIVIGSGIYIVCSQIRPIVGGVKLQPLEPVTRDYLDFAWPSDLSVGANILPVQWCPDNQTGVLIGPAPDQAYGFEVVGTMRIPQLSAANYQNVLSMQFPDLYVAASMCWFGLYQRDADLAAAWETTYQELLKSATVEETRKQFADMFPSPSTPVGLTAQG